MTSKQFNLFCINKYKIYKSINQQKRCCWRNSFWKWKHGSFVVHLLKHAELTVTLRNLRLKLQQLKLFFLASSGSESQVRHLKTEKAKRQNSMKSEGTGEKRNVCRHTHKTVSPNQLRKPITVIEQQKNCAGGWDLITFKKTIFI